MSRTCSAAAGPTPRRWSRTRAAGSRLGGLLPKAYGVRAIDRARVSAEEFGPFEAGSDGPGPASRAGAGAAARRGPCARPLRGTARGGPRVRALRLGGAEPTPENYGRTAAQRGRDLRRRRELRLRAALGQRDAPLLPRRGDRHGRIRCRSRSAPTSSTSSSACRGAAASASSSVPTAARRVPSSCATPTARA